MKGMYRICAYSTSGPLVQALILSLEVSWVLFQQSLRITKSFIINACSPYAPPDSSKSTELVSRLAMAPCAANTSLFIINSSFTAYVTFRETVVSISMLHSLGGQPSPVNTSTYSFMMALMLSFVRSSTRLTCSPTAISFSFRHVSIDSSVACFVLTTSKINVSSCWSDSRSVRGPQPFDSTCVPSYMVRLD